MRRKGRDGADSSAKLISSHRRSCLVGVWICAASDEERARALRRYRGKIATLDVVTDSIVDSVEHAQLFEQTTGHTVFGPHEWAGLRELRAAVLDAGDGGDRPDDWEHVRALARELLDRHSWQVPLEDKYFR